MEFRKPTANHALSGEQAPAPVAFRGQAPNDRRDADDLLTFSSSSALVELPSGN